MTDQHPISVPQELLNQWCRWKANQTPDELWRKIADNAAQWGADVELEKCCEWMNEQCLHLDGRYLRSDRRPKPLSLKEQALELLPEIKGEDVLHLCPLEVDKIRKALESLND